MRLPVPRLVLLACALLALLPAGANAASKGSSYPVVTSVTPAKLGIVYHHTSTKQLVDAVGPAWAKQIREEADGLVAGYREACAELDKRRAKIDDDLRALRASLAG